MSIITAIPRSQHQKHVLCHQADTELCLVSTLIENINTRMGGDGLTLLSFAGPIVPVENAVHRNLQHRWSALQEMLSSVMCYIKLRHGRLAEDVPSEGENGHVWLHRFRETFRDVRTEYNQLRENIIFLHFTLVYGVGVDTSVHNQFAERYEVLFTYGMELISEELIDGTRGRCKYWSKRILERVKEYTALSITERFIPGAASLSANELLQQVKKLFLLNLQRWDRTHGIDAPRTRRVLEVFAYELDAATLVPFTTRGMPFAHASPQEKTKERCSRCGKLGLV